MGETEEEMGRNSAAVKTLKAFYQTRLATLDSEALIAELQAAGDRGAIVIIAAFLDDALEFAIAQKMRSLSEPEYKDAFRSDGPFGAFSNRIEVAWLLNCIDDSLRYRLHDLREMRNACAHSKHAISLKTPALLNVCKRFLKGASFPALEDDPAGYTVAVIAEGFYLYNVIISSEQEALDLLKDRLSDWHKKKPST